MIFPTQGLNPVSYTAVRFFTNQLPGKTKFLLDAFIYFVQEANT